MSRPLLILAAAIALFCVAHALECDCAYGSVGPAADLNAGFCDCQCNSGYYPPNCLYTQNEQIPIRCILNDPFARYTGGRFEILVREGMSLSRDDGRVNLRIREGNETTVGAANPGKVVVQLSVAAPLANSLVEAVRLQAAWTRNLSGTSITIERASAVEVAASPRRALTAVIADTEYVRLYVDDIGWLIGVIALVLLLLIVECCALSTTTEKSQRAAAKDRDASAAAAIASMPPPGVRFVAPPHQPIRSTVAINPFVTPQPMQSPPAVVGEVLMKESPEAFESQPEEPPAAAAGPASVEVEEEHALNGDAGEDAPILSSDAERKAKKKKSKKARKDSSSEFDATADEAVTADFEDL